MAVEQVANDPFAVDCVREGLPDADVGEELVAQVEREIFVA